MSNAIQQLQHIVDNATDVCELVPVKVLSNVLGHCEFLQEQLWQTQDDLDNYHAENSELRAEIERLTKDRTESAETAAEVLKQNLELQRQIDELKKRLIDGFEAFKVCMEVK